MAEPKRDRSVWVIAGATLVAGVLSAAATVFVGKSTDVFTETVTRTETVTNTVTVRVPGPGPDVVVDSECGAPESAPPNSDGPGEPDNAQAEARALSLMTRVERALEAPEDVDVFYFCAPGSARLVQVQLTNQTDCSVYVRVQNESGEFSTEEHVGEGTTRTTRGQLPGPGIYYVDVGDYSGCSQDTSPHRYSLRLLDPSDATQ